MFSTKYITNNLSLINSLIIKSETVAESMNRQLELAGLVYNKAIKTEWPYYLNLAGKPHSANTDIYFTTLETNQRVMLTEANLSLYPKSKRELLNYGEMFNSLLQTYIGQNIYIRGILNPIPMDVSIPAIDGTILHYSSDLVEYNEVSLISELEESSKHFLDRWDIPEYSLIENLYAPSVYGSLINFLSKRLIALRIKNIASVEIHSRYAISTLDSYMGIGKYSHVLTRNSRLWLAKTIKYITANIGKEFVLELLDNNILRPHGVILKEINLIQDTPSRLGEIDPAKPNTIYTDRVLHAISKSDSDNSTNSVLLQGINNDSFVADFLKTDYSDTEQRFKDTSDTLVNLHHDEDTKFYLLDKNDSVSYTRHSKHDMMLASIVLYYNPISGLRNTDILNVVTKNDITYNLPAKNVFEYIMYSLHVYRGYSDSEYLFDTPNTDTSVTINIPSIIRHDFDIGDVLSKVDSSEPVYNSLLLAIKNIIVDPNTSTISEYTAAQLEAQSLIGACITRIRGPIQENIFNMLLKCISLGSITISDNKTLGEALESSGMDYIFPTYETDNLKTLMSSLSGIENNGAEAYSKINDGLVNILKALTSYTVLPLTSNNFSSEYVYSNKIGVLEGVTISGLTSGDIRCGVVPAVINTAIANDDQLSITAIDSSILYSVDEGNRALSMYIDVGRRRGISVERPILVSSNFEIA